MKILSNILSALTLAGILIAIGFIGQQLNRAYNPALIHQEKIATFNINQVEQSTFLKSKIGGQ